MRIDPRTRSQLTMARALPYVRFDLAGVQR